MLTGAQLGQQPGAYALAVRVGLQQALGQGFVEAGCQLPQRGETAVRRRCLRRGVELSRGAGQSSKRSAQPRCRAARAAAHQHQQIGFDAVHQGLVEPARRQVGLCDQFTPRPFDRPQVGRVSARDPGQLPQRPVLRKQRQRRDRLASQTPGDEIEHCEGAALDRLDRCQGDQPGSVAQVLQRGFGRAQQFGGAAQPDQFERAHALVQLAARLAQQRRVDRVEFGELGLLPEMAAQRPVGKLQRAPQRLLHPDQRAEIVALGNRRQRFGFVHLCPSTTLLASAAASGRADQS